MNEFNFRYFWWIRYIAGSLGLTSRDVLGRCPGMLKHAYRPGWDFQLV
jgi:hypothetical protein